MNRPIIKGTPIHKASIAKAKSESIVSQRRTQADATLTGAATAMGLSRVPEAQSYKLKSYDLSNIEDKRVKKDKPPEYDPTEDSDYNDKEIQADLDRITAEEGLTTSTTTKKKGYENWKVREEEKNIAEAEAMLERTAKNRDAKLNKAAKKHNVKPEDLEAKEINGKKEYFPKQGVQGGFDRNLIPVIDEQTGDPKLDQDGEVVMRIDPEDKGTKWDDKLGRFKKAKASTGTMEEQQKAVEEMKPKYPQGMDPSLEAKGEIALNYETNTYEYTNAYNSRIAREKIAATEAERANQNAVTSEPVVEKTTTTPDRKPKPSDFEGSFKEKQAQYKIANEEWYQAQQAKKGKSPMEMRDDRIYKFANKDGPVRRNMIKGGYTPE